MFFSPRVSKSASRRPLAVLLQRRRSVNQQHQTTWCRRFGLVKCKIQGGNIFVSSLIQTPSSWRVIDSIPGYSWKVNERRKTCVSRWFESKWEYKWMSHMESYTASPYNFSKRCRSHWPLQLLEWGNSCCDEGWDSAATSANLHGLLPVVMGQKLGLTDIRLLQDDARWYNDIDDMIYRLYRWYTSFRVFSCETDIHNERTLHINSPFQRTMHCARSHSHRLTLDQYTVLNKVSTLPVI